MDGVEGCEAAGGQDPHSWRRHHSTNVVEHPELVAWGIRNFASVVGRKNVIAGTDCGFAQSYNIVRCHPSVQWAKLESLVDGARMASKDLWAYSH
jgi:5-methyltetrahydropteroyltriglutamate--homocysteine methyltransferase